MANAGPKAESLEIGLGLEQRALRRERMPAFSPPYYDLPICCFSAAIWEPFFLGVPLRSFARDFPRGSRNRSTSPASPF
jgi:hypothetical protein